MRKNEIKLRRTIKNEFNLMIDAKISKGLVYRWLEFYYGYCRNSITFTINKDW